MYERTHNFTGSPFQPTPALVNALTIDVEDYFQVQALADTVPRTAWEEMPRRVEANTERLLASFERAGVHATFFMLGWVAERHPALTRRITNWPATATATNAWI